MKRILTYFIPLAVLVIISACTNDDLQLPDPNGGSSTILKEGVPAHLSLSVDDISQMGVSYQTKATAEEEKIHNIWILQFDGTDDDSQLLTRQYAMASDSNKIYLSSNSQFENNRIVIIANTFDVDSLTALKCKSAGGDNTGITYADFLKESAPTDKMLKNIANNGNAIPMYGQTIVPKPNLDGVTNATIHLTRLSLIHI